MNYYIIFLIVVALFPLHYKLLFITASTTPAADISKEQLVSTQCFPSGKDGKKSAAPATIPAADTVIASIR